MAFVSPPLHLGSPITSTYANTSLIPGLSLSQQAASVWQPQGQAVSTYTDDSIHSFGHEDIATDPPIGFYQHEESDAPFTNYIQTPVNFATGPIGFSQCEASDASFTNHVQSTANFPAQQTFIQAPLGYFQSPVMISCDLYPPTSRDGFSDQNLSFNPQHSSQSLNQSLEDNDIIPMPMLPISASTSIAVPAPSSAPSSGRFTCSYFPCNKKFKRNPDRVRHENSIHSNHPGVHLCPVIGCAKAQGKGFSRPDKVTEHLWKCHGNLGFRKRT